MYVDNATLDTENNKQQGKVSEEGGGAKYSVVVIVVGKRGRC